MPFFHIAVDFVRHGSQKITLQCGVSVSKVAKLSASKYCSWTRLTWSPSLTGKAVVSRVMRMFNRTMMVKWELNLLNTWVTIIWLSLTCSHDIWVGQTNRNDMILFRAYFWCACVNCFCSCFVITGLVFCICRIFCTLLTVLYFFFYL